MYPFQFAGGLEALASREILQQKPITLLPENLTFTEGDIRHVHPHGVVVVCDFSVSYATEPANPMLGALTNGNIINIDHHGNDPRLESRIITSTTQAIEYVNRFGILPDDQHCVINHTDTDSILSSLIVRGIIPPESIFAEASIAADHTGAENPIADLLQAIK